MATEDFVDGFDSATDDAGGDDHLAGLAAELTGSAGLSDDAGYGDEVSAELADEVEEYDQHHGNRQVPLAALRQERSRRQELQADLDVHRQQVAALQAQLAQVQAFQQQAQQMPEIPSFAEDPEGHVSALRQRFEAELQRMQSGQVQAAQEQQLRAELAQVQSSIAGHEAAFMEQHSDYQEVTQTVHDNVLRQLRARHPGASEGQLRQLQAVACMELVQHCAQQGIDPCQFMYDRGRQLLGLTRAGQQAHVESRPQAPAKAAGKLSVQDVAEMSDEDFDALFQSMSKANGPRFGFGR